MIVGDARYTEATCERSDSARLALLADCWEFFREWCCFLLEEFGYILRGLIF